VYAISSGTPRADHATQPPNAVVPIANHEARLRSRDGKPRCFHARWKGGSELALSDERSDGVGKGTAGRRDQHDATTFDASVVSGLDDRLAGVQ
jgi:hypothetical protein